MAEDLIRNFASDFDTIFVLELSSGELLLQQCIPVLEDWVNETSPQGYDEYRLNFSRKFLYPEDRDWFIRRTSPAAIKANLKNENTFFINHRIKTSNGSTVFYQTKFTRIGDSDNYTKVLFGGHSIDDVEKENLQFMEEMATAHHNAVIASLAEDFDYICYINLQSKHVRRFHASERFKPVLDNLPMDLRSYQRLEMFLHKLVLPRDLVDFVDTVNLDVVTGTLEHKKSYEVNFRSQGENDTIAYYKLKFVKDKNDPDGIIMGLLPFDDQIREEIKQHELEATRQLMEEQMRSTLRERTQEIRNKNKALSRINETIIEMIGDITEARDIESGEHISRVKGFTHILARQVSQDWPEYKLTPHKVDLIASASALHDIGKISIPDAILLKPGRLTPEEFEIMKTHTTKGCEILKKAPKDWSPEYLETSMEICHYHHEKYDGNGYPLGLKGDAIPISAQIVSIADCYDALSSKRVYKKAIDSDTAYQMILNGECGIFNDKLLASFKKCKPLFDRHDFAKEQNYYASTSINSFERLANKRILYVVKNDMTSVIGREMLEGEGATVIEADTEDKAIQLTNDNFFDAVIMDSSMAPASPVHTAQLIRNLRKPFALTIPIIYLSSGNENLEQECSNCGINAYMRKPITILELTQALVNLLS